MMNHTLLKVLLSMILAVIAGTLSGTTAGIGSVTFYQIYSLVGAAFFKRVEFGNWLSVSASIITGTARLGWEKSFKELGLKTFGYFIGTSALAIALGWILANLIEPGFFAKQVSALPPERLKELNALANEGAFAKVQQILLEIVPSNILAVAVQGKMLGLIFFTLLFGFFLSRIELGPANMLYNFFQGVFQVMMKITLLIMKVLPIAVFALVAKVVATTGYESIASAGYFFITVLIGLFLYMFVLLPLVLKVVGQVNPFAHMRAMVPALVTAFSTTSSAATLPVTIECVELQVGVSNRISSFTLPLGTSANLAGSSLQVIVAVFTVVQSYGIELSLATQVLVFFITLLLSIGMAGVPSASLISIVVILSAIGFPADGVGLVIAVERILDMCRTAVNVFSNSCCAVLVARSAGEKLKI